MPKYSFPKEKIKVLLLENIHPAAEEEFRRAGYTNIERLDKALSDDELRTKLKDVQIVGIRSKTKLKQSILEQAPRLQAIGAFCIGTDQINLETATQRGIAAFNSPHSSTRSVAELTMASVIHLFRRTSEKTAAAHQGGWLKTALGAHEVRNKTLGIIGYGRIGSQVSVLAEALGMKVLFYDIEPKLAMGTAEQANSFEDVLAQADALTLHVPKDPSTKHMLGKDELAKIKPGACLVNYARGDVIVAEDVAEAVQSGQLSGAAVDVYEKEPATTSEAFSSPLQGLPNVILTPHIGGSTEEAQANIGRDVAIKLVNFMDAGNTTGSVTVPELNLPAQAGTHRLLHIHANQPGIITELNRRLSDNGTNVVGQYLKTNEAIGYVVFDIRQTGQTDASLELIREIPGTIRARSLY